MMADVKCDGNLCELRMKIFKRQMLEFVRELVRHGALDRPVKLSDVFDDLSYATIMLNATADVLIPFESDTADGVCLWTPHLPKPCINVSSVKVRPEYNEYLKEL